MKRTIIGIGNAGCNIAESIRLKAETEYRTSTQWILTDTNEMDLRNHSEEESLTVLLKFDSEDMYLNIFNNTEEVIVISGLGGRTGTKFTELVVRDAKNFGIEKLTAIVTIPFMFEGEQRVERAYEAANRLTAFPEVNVIAYKNDDLLHQYPDLNLLNAFEIAVGKYFQ